ncbi:hypothetical protein J3A83DRAFT_4185245 [Scleroderma citrinum]
MACLACCDTDSSDDGSSWRLVLPCSLDDTPGKDEGDNSSSEERRGRRFNNTNIDDDDEAKTTIQQPLIRIPLDRQIACLSGRASQDQNELKILVVKHLDVHQTYTQQRKKNVESLRKEALKEIPFLSRYESGWATTVLVKRLFARRYILRLEAGLIEAHEAYATSTTSRVPTRVIPLPPATLEEFLKDITPMVTHHMFPLVSGGLVDNERFANFLRSPLPVKAGFIHGALQHVASREEIQAIVEAAERWGA